MVELLGIVVRRSSADVSLAYLAVLQLGFGLWIAYGVAVANPVLVLPNSMASIVGAVTILVTWRYRPLGRTLDDQRAGSGFSIGD